MSCTARIKPFKSIDDAVGNETVVACEREDEHDQHRGVLRDYAWPGSATTINWFETDRRNYHEAEK